jgi:hypothetical protein
MTAIDTSMTVDDLLVMLDPPDGEVQNWEQIDALLAQILTQAARYYDNCSDFVAWFALDLARYAIEAGDEYHASVAETLAHVLGDIAAFMLIAQSADKWPSELRTRLETIENTIPKPAATVVE